jgi:hypothetical protein
MVQQSIRRTVKARLNLNTAVFWAALYISADLGESSDPEFFKALIVLLKPNALPFSARSCIKN